MPRSWTTRLLIPVIALAAVTVGLTSVADAQLTPRGNRPVRTCESITDLHLDNTTITSAKTVAASGATPEYCAVQAVVTNPPLYNDQVKVGVFLPTRTWNGRFQGTGGGGFSGGNPDSPSVDALQAGYATAGTDTGHAGRSATFALDASGNSNWALINDFGYLGIHNMTVLSKQLIEHYYGRAARYSYFNGCSTGGRQGLIEAQRYGDDYDGIVAESPAINSQKLRSAAAWGLMNMNLAHDFLPQCKFEAVNDAVVQKCDSLDGVEDGIIGDWEHCTFDARTLIGVDTPCGPITATDADIVNKIWDGPRDPKGKRLWFGHIPGTPFRGLNTTQTDSAGNTTGRLFDSVEGWYQYFLTKDPTWDWRTLTYDQFVKFFLQSESEFAELDVTSQARPDLSQFEQNGGKVVMWAGAADPLVYQLGLLDYYRRVQNANGGAKNTQQFARLFMAPGVGHCGGGVGAAPTDAFQAVVDWVEHGKAPKQLSGEHTDSSGDVDLTRPVCLYPQVAVYDGHGDTHDASNFSCRDNFATPGGGGNGN
jgi:hypothetical protein